MSVTAARGFVANGLSCNIKASGAADLALVASESGAAYVAAGTFTTNKAAAAPVQVSRAHLQTSGGRAGAVILNSGCANAATGAAGLAAARQTCAALGARLGLDPSHVLVCSTGLIGDQLPLDRLLSGLDDLVEGRRASRDGAAAAARAIMTTDTHEKEVVVEADGFVVGAMAKGAGMIAPNMATMLAVLTTDAACGAEELADALRGAVAVTFNELTVDGCTSTNDTVLALSSGLGARPTPGALGEAMTEVCGALAMALAEDAEGTTRVARIIVRGARSNEDARRAARRVAESNLVKTSLYGADPYWGRILSELGSSGADFELERAEIAYGGIVACRGGAEAAHDRSEAAAHLSGRVVEITCDLGLGVGEAAVLTCDLGHGYIDENMRTS